MNLKDNVLRPEIFDILENQTPGAGGEIQLTDAIDTLNNTQRVFAREFKGQRYDVGDKLGFVETNILYGLKHPEIKDSLKDFLIETVASFDKEKTPKKEFKK